MDILSKITSSLLYFDGAMGTELQKHGLKAGELPEEISLSAPDIIESIHLSYLDAGCDVIKTNTFGLNSLKIQGERLPVLADAALTCAENAIKKAGGKKRYIALDIGPLGKILKPFGDLPFEEAVSLFAEIIRLGEGRADCILLETMNDAYETKAAVLAAKENSSLPVFVTNVYDEKEKLMTGADALSMIALLEGLGVDALGLNCSLGPKKMNEVLKTFAKYSSLPLIISPNAGLPRTENGKTVYDISPEEFAKEMKEAVLTGAHGLGGCCGTNPDYIRALIETTSDMAPRPLSKKGHCLVSSYTHAVEFSDSPVVIGERINPTGKKRVKEALKEGDLAFILREGVYQQQAGAAVLDVNCGLPEIREKEVLRNVVENLQAVCDAPLQIDTGDKEALEAALRIYNGKAVINSVNGKEESMHSVFPLVKKYGGVVVALTLDEKGIPETAEERVRIAEKIIETAKSYGIDEKNIIVDTLTMAISTDINAADITLKAIRELHNKGIRTVLGVSNISFGLPHRDYVNSRFFAKALAEGLSAAIMNPHSENMNNSLRNYTSESICDEYITFAKDLTDEVMAMEGITPAPADSSHIDLKSAIESGLCEESGKLAKALLTDTTPLSVINEYIVPALDKVGSGFEEGKVYLPSLLMSAEAAKAAFDAVKDVLLTQGESNTAKEKIVIATVKGDIHDIGKNIVKILLENYGYKVVDLGKDISPEIILNTAEKEGARLVALSALMTTTVPAMEETVKLIHESLPHTKVMVGGAVLSQEYADMIAADFYSKDAMGAVRIAEKLFNKN